MIRRAPATRASEPRRRVGVAVHLGGRGRRHLHPHLVPRQAHRVPGRDEPARLGDHQLEHPAHAAHDAAPGQDEHVEQAVRGVDREPRPQRAGDRLAAVGDEHRPTASSSIRTPSTTSVRRVWLEARQQPARGEEVRGDPVAALLLAVGRRDELGVEPGAAGDAEAHPRQRSQPPGRPAADELHGRVIERRRDAGRQRLEGAAGKARGPPERPSRTGCRCRMEGCRRRCPRPRGRSGVAHRSVATATTTSRSPGRRAVRVAAAIVADRRTPRPRRRRSRVGRSRSARHRPARPGRSVADREASGLTTSVAVGTAESLDGRLSAKASDRRVPRVTQIARWCTSQRRRRSPRGLERARTMVRDRSRPVPLRDLR